MFRAALASAVIAFLMDWSQVSFRRPSCLAWAQMEGLRPLRNRRIKTGSKITVSALNSQRTIYRCLKWAVQSITFSNWCWESFLMVLQIMSTKASGLPRLWQRKALKPFQLIGTLVWASISHEYCCQRNKAVFFRKIAANGTRFGPMAPVVAKWSLHCWKKL